MIGQYKVFVLQSLTMTSVNAFIEFKRFATGIELTSKKLKDKVTQETISSKLEIEHDAFVDNLKESVHNIQGKLDSIETKIHGPVESRLSQVTAIEILQRCKSLHDSNEEMLNYLINKYDQKGLDIKVNWVMETDNLSEKSYRYNYIIVLTLIKTISFILLI